MKKSELLMMLAATAELCGAQFSPAAAEIFVRDLEGYPNEQVAGALKRCRQEVRGRLTVADVIARLDDGRPGVEQAWSMVAFDEAVTVVWTEEIRKAWAVSYRLLAEGDRVAARMAFKEAYVAAVQAARERREPVVWSVSLGTDPNGRSGPVLEAVEKGRIPLEHAQLWLPPSEMGQAKLPPPHPEVRDALLELLSRPPRRLPDRAAAAGRPAEAGQTDETSSPPT